MRKKIHQKQSLVFDKKLTDFRVVYPSDNKDLPLPINEFPIIKWSEFEEYDENRLFDFTYSVFFFFFVTGCKYYIVTRFKIATFCDIQPWEEFDLKVEKNQIKMIEIVNCSLECSKISNTFFTKLFESNYYCFYCVNVYFSIYFGLKNKIKGWMLFILTWIPLLNHLIGHGIFFNNKSFAFMIGNFFYTAELLLIIKKSMLHFKVFTAIMLIMGYFSAVKFFFEVIFPFLMSGNPERTLQLVPVIIFLIKLFGKWILQYPYLKRIETNTVTIYMTFFIIFEYIYIGTLHTLLNKTSLDSTALWTTIIQTLIINFIGKTSFYSRVSTLLLKKSLTASKKPSEKKNLIVYLYNGIKTELEVYSIMIYFLLLCVQYYDYCMTTLVDCMGRPIISMSEIKPTHFALVAILMGQLMVENIFMRLCQRIWRKKIFNIKKVRFTSLKERFFYICMMFGVSINFGLPGLYSMMWSIV